MLIQVIYIENIEANTGGIGECHSVTKLGIFNQSKLTLIEYGVSFLFLIKANYSINLLYTIACIWVRCNELPMHKMQL